MQHLALVSQDDGSARRLSPPSSSRGICAKQLSDVRPERVSLTRRSPTDTDLGSADDLDWHWESVSVPSGPLMIK